MSPSSGPGFFATRRRYALFGDFVRALLHVAALRITLLGGRRCDAPERVLLRGERALLHFVDVRRERLADDFRAVEELLDELRRELGVHAEQVVDDEHLAVARGPRADADGGDAQLRRDLRGEVRG